MPGMQLTRIIPFLYLTHSKFQVDYEPSFLQMNATERSSVGRMSFQKFNSAVEVRVFMSFVIDVFVNHTIGTSCN